ncbi:MAG: peptide deformylase [Gammaproteobacteria bacterium RIFCSPHIGHO2_12_FULL_37_14]|nr:MAG: peptide deformylase [Gammaproteobacteria bacterium RIFCSPHIGHO2_12_FULL_37_14]
MAIQTVVKLGNTQLATPSLKVNDFHDPQLIKLIQDMKDTMNEKKGVGIAAPQIGVNLRVVIFGFEKSERYPNEAPVPFTILINPIIEILSDEMVDGWEGCLSVPGLRGLVPRYQKIKYTGLDLDQNPIERIAEGFHARIIQHECDHLDGILFHRRIKDMRYFGFVM